jgi:hypothetical protein
MKSTVICHIFNEEYLLPFWLQHHKSIFDHGEIINYHSTDQSIALVKQICPHWNVRTSRNPNFKAAEVDTEVMDIEQNITGIKIALNVTEFIFPKNNKPISSYFKSDSPQCFALEAFTPITNIKFDSDPINLPDLINEIHSIPWAKGARLGHRFLHNYPTGQYTVGRHYTAHQSIIMDSTDITLIWLGYYPWTERTLARKLQIMGQIPESDTREHYEIMKQHTMNEEMLEAKRKELYNSTIVFIPK